MAARKTTHKNKHLKRVKRELLFWRKELISALDYVRRRLYDPKEIEEVTDAVSKDAMSIFHIDRLISDLDDWFDEDTELSVVLIPEVRELARVKVDGKIYNVEKGTTEEQIRERFKADFEEEKQADFTVRL